MKYSELEAQLKASGCYCVRNGKRHPLWYSPITKKEFATSYHKSQEVAVGTLNKILKDAGLK